VKKLTTNFKLIFTFFQKTREMWRDRGRLEVVFLETYVRQWYSPLHPILPFSCSMSCKTKIREVFCSNFGPSLSVEIMICPICIESDSFSVLWMTPWLCDHAVHRNCLARWFVSATNGSIMTCYLCRSNPATPLAAQLFSSEVHHAYYAVVQAGENAPAADFESVPNLRPAPADIVPCCCVRMSTTDVHLWSDTRMYWCAHDHTWVCYSCGRVVTLGDRDLCTPTAVRPWADRQLCQIHGSHQALVTQYSNYLIHDNVVDRVQTISSYSIRCVRTCPATPLELPELLACPGYYSNADPITIVDDDDNLLLMIPRRTPVPSMDAVLPDA
jgi:hypothetical protein